jgi:hypothetical protein
VEVGGPDRLRGDVLVVGRWARGAGDRVRADLAVVVMMSAAIAGPDNEKKSAIAASTVAVEGRLRMNPTSW